MHLFFVRHGQTEYNLKNIVQGATCDSPLTQTGIQQAKNAGEKLKDVSFHTAYVSPLGRAKETLKWIEKENKAGIPQIIPDDRLREIHFGKYDGQPIQRLQDDEILSLYRNYPDHFDKTLTGGEDYYDLENRGKDFIYEITKKEPEEANILIVSHAVFLTTLLKRLMHCPMPEIRKEGLLGNASISVLEWDPVHERCTLLAYNE